MNKKYLDEVKVILFIGILLIAVSPYILTRNWSCIDFSSTGQIGDTIGGLTAPLTNLLGAVLVFYALKAQIDANMLIQDQISSQRNEDELKKARQVLFDNFKILREDMNDFTVIETRKNQIGLSATQIDMLSHKGSDAITFLVSQLKHAKEFEKDSLIDESHKYNQLITLLESINLFLFQVKESSIPFNDKAYFISLMKYQFYSVIKVPIKKFEQYKASQRFDKLGNTIIQGIPIALFDIVEKIEKQLVENY